MQNKLPVKYLVGGPVIGFLIGLGITSFSITPMYDMGPLVNLLSETSQNQIAQAGFFFTCAAWLHAGRVKKEIKLNFEALTHAIDKFADAFREDLKVQSAILNNLASRVQILEDKYTTGGKDASSPT